MRGQARLGCGLSVLQSMRIGASQLVFRLWSSRVESVSYVLRSVRVLCLRLTLCQDCLFKRNRRGLVFRPELHDHKVAGFLV